MKKEKTLEKSVQLDLKFQHFAAFNDVRMVYQFIDSHSGRGKKKETASTFMIHAFNTWDPSLTPDIVNAYVQSKTVELMLKEHNIKSIEELYIELSQEVPGELDELPACGRRGMKFYLNKEEDNKLYTLFKNGSKEYTEKERAFLVYIFVKNYIARENPISYYEIATRRLWQQLVNLYYEDKEGVRFSRFIELVIEPVVFIGIEKNNMKSKKAKEKESIKQRELKELFGK